MQWETKDVVKGLSGGGYIKENKEGINVGIRGTFEEG
jgi:hypothetical protein